MKSLIKIVLLAVVISHCFGCASTPQVVERNPRIIYQDLTQKPIAYKVPDMPAELKQATQTASASGPVLFIEFANDAFKTFDESSLDDFQVNPEDILLVVGHSHGYSSVGTLALASKRAKHIAKYLEALGAKNIHTMASWGDNPVNFSPTRGVHVYRINPDSKGKGLPVLFAKEVKQGPVDIVKDAALALMDGLKL